MITLLYYTASKIEEYLGENVRKHLKSLGDYPIVSVSQKPLDFGRNICVGEIGQSYYNCYKQILIGAKAVKTKYVALCEDDTLYTKEHLNHRPATDKVFSFNKNTWYAEEQEYWNKGWVGMCACIVATQYLIDTLTPRFEEFPKEIKGVNRYFQEPGRFDGAKTEYWYSKTPILTFNFFHTLGGKMDSKENEVVSRQELAGWGDCWELKRKFWGRARPREKLKPRYA